MLLLLLYTDAVSSCYLGVGRLCGELIATLALFIVEDDHPV